MLVLGALGFRDRKETDFLQLMGRVARGWWLVAGGWWLGGWWLGGWVAGGWWLVAGGWLAGGWSGERPDQSVDQSAHLLDQVQICRKIIPSER